VLAFRSGIEALEDHIIRVTGCLFDGKKNLCNFHDFTRVFSESVLRCETLRRLMRMNGTISRQMATGCWQTPSSSIKSKWYILYT
jgi:hypothetical protein